jgi:2,4-dienoyl-CoA reductase-like NADH-dependent reductase (Old Yellow Enzyme family)
VSLLFSPLTIKSVAFRNRVVMPPMVRELGDEEGRVTDAVVESYVARARAGTGTIIVEATAIAEAGRCWSGGLCAYAHRHVAGLRRLAEAIHAEGAVALIQLVHGGPQATPQVSGRETVGPSAIRPAHDKPVPRALTVVETHAIQEEFATAAGLALEAGFDGVEIHGAHGYLLDSFLSKKRNERDDAYGGAIEGRMRMVVETCDRVRQSIGTGPLLDCRISLFNKVAEGFSPAELKTLVEGLENTGLDLIHVSTIGGLEGAFDTSRSLGQWVKGVTSLPIILAGRLGEPADAERALTEGHADLVAVGGRMIRNAEWTAYARQALSGS